MPKNFFKELSVKDIADDKAPVVVITSNQYKPNIGGVENSLYYLAKSYQQKGYKPLIITSDLNPKIESLPFHEVDEDIEIYRYSMKPKKLWGLKVPTTISGFINAIRLYKKLRKRYQPRLTVARYHFNVFFLFMAGYKNIVYLVPGIVKFQNAAKNAELSNFKDKVKRRYHMAVQYIALSVSDCIAVFSENMDKQVSLIKPQVRAPLLTKPGVDESRFYPLDVDSKWSLRKSLGEETNGKVFLCVGRCVKAKGFDIAINAFSLIEDKNAQLWIVGDGPLLPELKALVLENRLTERVKFFGAQSDVERFYMSADYFLMSSIYEPLGQTILEALSSGLRVLAFRSSENVETASSEILSDSVATFIEEANAELLCESINTHLSDTDKNYEKMSSDSRSYALKNFTWLALADSLEREVSDEK